MVRLNCDIGERGSAFPLDVELMQCIHEANIACGGHAGDAESVRYFRLLAEAGRVDIAAHLSYPDKVNFGRKSLLIGQQELHSSLTEQLSLLDGITRVKFHGALYNDALSQRSLAESLTLWLLENKVTELVTLAPSAIAEVAGAAGIAIRKEGFAERRYIRDQKTGALLLMPRSEAPAVIHTLVDAVEQGRRFMADSEVMAYTRNYKSGEWAGTPVKNPIDTLCIHSDSPIALELARALYRMLL